MILFYNILYLKGQTRIDFEGLDLNRLGIRDQKGTSNLDYFEIVHKNTTPLKEGWQ